MFQWLWAMNTNQLLASVWFGEFLLSCCADLEEKRYKSIVERFDRIENTLDTIRTDMHNIRYSVRPAY